MSLQLVRFTNVIATGEVKASPATLKCVAKEIYRSSEPSAQVL